MKNPTIGDIRSLYEKHVKFWFTDLFEFPSGRHESTGIVEAYLVGEERLRIIDDKDGVRYYVEVDHVEVLECKTCRFFNHPVCVRKSGGVLVEYGHIKYEPPEMVAETWYCKYYE
ncbi:MAG: hypothetical protein V3W19_12210 [Desulfatiglandales bacterium]